MSAGAEYQKAKVQRQCARIRALKESTPCLDCGGSFPYYVMTFDHVPERGPKLFTFGHLQRRWVNEARLVAELEKCDIVCANCQAIRTHQRKEAEAA